MMIQNTCARWLARVAIAVAIFASHAGTGRADTWSYSSGCGCETSIPSGGYRSPSSAACTWRPFWMRATPVYTSTATQIPVTNYQPQVMNDPLSGVSVTTVQPCNAYESQWRRTPGCSLWQRLLNWWRSCRCFRRPAVACAESCPPASQWVVSPADTTTAPYYAPPSNGRLVPVPSNATPTNPVPADRRPQLDPVTPRPVGEGSASRLSTPDTEVFVHTIEAAAPLLELGPPLVAPGLQTETLDAPDELESVAVPFDDHSAALDDDSLALIPVSWSTAAGPDEPQLPTDVVWDDTGWRSEQ